MCFDLATPTAPTPQDLAFPPTELWLKTLPELRGSKFPKSLSAFVLVE